MGTTSLRCGLTDTITRRSEVTTRFMPEQGEAPGQPLPQAPAPGRQEPGSRHRRCRSCWPGSDAMRQVLRRVGDGRHPWVAGEGVVEGGQDRHQGYDEGERLAVPAGNRGRRDDAGSRAVRQASKGPLTSE